MTDEGSEDPVDGDRDADQKHEALLAVMREFGDLMKETMGIRRKEQK